MLHFRSAITSLSLELEFVQFVAFAPQLLADQTMTRLFQRATSWPLCFFTKSRGNYLSRSASVLAMANYYKIRVSWQFGWRGARETFQAIREIGLKIEERRRRTRRRKKGLNSIRDRKSDFNSTLHCSPWHPAVATS